MVLADFTDSLCTSFSVSNCLIISLSDRPVFRCDAENVVEVEGEGWSEEIPPTSKFDMILCDLPRRTERVWVNVGESEYRLNREWLKIRQIMQYLKEDGVALFTYNYLSFTNQYGEAIRDFLNYSELSVVGNFTVSDNGREGELIALQKGRFDTIFAAEIDHETDLPLLAANFKESTPEENLRDGVIIPVHRFPGIEPTRWCEQLDALESDYKRYQQRSLEELIVDDTRAYPPRTHENHENSILIPLLGSDTKRIFLDVASLP